MRAEFLNDGLATQKQPLTYEMLLARNLSSSARLAVFHTVSKFYERYRSTQSPPLPTGGRRTERSFTSKIRFTGQTPKLLELLRVVIHAFTGVDIYNYNATETALQGKWSYRLSLH